MVITKEQLETIKIIGRYKMPPEKVMVILDIPRRFRAEFLELFNDPESEIRLAWERGSSVAEFENMESLDKVVKDSSEGAGDAAQALSSLRFRQSTEQLRKDLFGV
jgi:hypothetical protein